MEIFENEKLQSRQRVGSFAVKLAMFFHLCTSVFKRVIPLSHRPWFTARVRHLLNIVNSSVPYTPIFARISGFIVRAFCYFWTNDVLFLPLITKEMIILVIILRNSWCYTKFVFIFPRSNEMFSIYMVKIWVFTNFYECHFDFCVLIGHSSEFNELYFRSAKIAGSDYRQVCILKMLYNIIKIKDGERGKCFCQVVKVILVPSFPFKDIFCFKSLFRYINNFLKADLKYNFC